MSKKRTSEEANDDEQQTNEPSSDLVQQDAKRAKLIPWSDTTLQDLPIELLEDILIKAVVLEVKDLRLAKSVWKEKADLVINRLQTVCLQWSNITTTNYFRNKVHGILDGTAQKKFRLETLHQSTVEPMVKKVVTMKDEVFMLCRPEDQEPFINVHDRNNMMEVKAVIPLPGIVPVDIAACGVSNCVYILNCSSDSPSVLRIANDEEHQYNISTWDNDMSLPFERLCPGLNGKLIVLSREDKPNPSVVSIYNADGSLQHSITLFPDTHGFDYISSVIQKSSGNLVLATNADKFHREIKEIDAMGRIVAKYGLDWGFFVVSVADAYGRLLTFRTNNEVCLLDSEFNLLDLTGPSQDTELFYIPLKTHFNNERNEIACISDAWGSYKYAPFLTIFRLAEE